jgi:hypothetical protein
MAAFPILKTGVVAQYPATRSAEYRNQCVRFLDGSEQRYRDSSGPLHRWVISLTLLDESEREALVEFFEELTGTFGSFSFTDPWDSHVYADCSLANDDIEVRSLAEMRGATSLTVMENRI